MSTKVSICIPAFRQPTLLRQVLRSVADQTFQDCEVVVTDDSPDASVEEVVTEFQDLLDIHYYRNEQRLGSPENWNEAVRRSQGDYIKILHHDDWFYDAESLGHFVSMLDECPSAALGFGFTLVWDVNQGHHWVNDPSASVVARIRRDPSQLFFGNRIGAPSATIFRRAAFTGFDRNLKWLVDVEFYVRLLQKAPDLACCCRPLICTTHGADHQVTSECRGNKDVEAYEWLYLYRLLDRGPLPSLRRLRMLSRTLRALGIRSPEELTPHIKGLPVPRALAALMQMRGILQRMGLRSCE